MPEYTFDGHYPHAYPELKHADGTNAGIVEPGEIRDLTGAPDHMWHPATDEDRAARAAVIAGREAETGEADGAPPDPAPKASRRKAGQDSDNEAGETGSKES